MSDYHDATHGGRLDERNTCEVCIADAVRMARNRQTKPPIEDEDEHWENAILNGVRNAPRPPRDPPKT